MRINVPLAIDMTPEQQAAYAREIGIPNTAAAVREHVINAILTVASEEIERTASGEPALGTVGLARKPARG